MSAVEFCVISQYKPAPATKIRKSRPGYGRLFCNVIRHDCLIEFSSKNLSSLFACL